MYWEDRVKEESLIYRNSLTKCMWYKTTRENSMYMHQLHSVHVVQLNIAEDYNLKNTYS